MKKINFRLLGALILVFAVLCTAGYFLHDYQTRRNAEAYLREAKRAQRENRPQDAVVHLRRYVKLAPHDAEGLALYAQQLADLGHVQQGYLLLGQALRRAPDRDDWRRRSVDLAIALRRYSDAKESIESHLLKNSPRDGELLAQLGLCHAGLGDNSRAVQAFQAAIEASPMTLQSYAILAELFRTRLKDREKAEQTLDQMVSNNPKDHRAYLVRGQYYLTQAKAGGTSQPPSSSAGPNDEAVSPAERAGKDAESALELKPKAPETAFFAAEVAMVRGRHDEARTIALQMIQLWPEMSRVYSLLSDLEIAAGNAAAATDWLKRGTMAAPADLDLRWNYANLLLEQGRSSEAADEIKSLRAGNHPDAPVKYLEARISIVDGRWLESVRQLRALRPQLAEWPDLQKQADFWLGRCHQQLGNVDQQLAAYRRALDTDPSWVPARLGVADALLAAGRLQEAQEEYRQLSALPNVPLVVPLRLAQVLLVSNLRRDPAERDWTAFEQTLKQLERVKPDLPQVTLLRAELLLAQGRDEEAKELIASARSKQIGNLELLAADVTLAQRSNDWPRAEQLLREAESETEDRVGLRLLEARTIAMRDGSDAGPALNTLWTTISPSLTNDEKVRFAEGLSSLSLAVDETDLAESLATIVADARPNNLQIRLLLLDLGFRGDRDDLVAQVLADVRRIEGEGPLWHYGEALRLVGSVDNGKSPLLERAKDHLVAAKVARPGWSRIPLLSAEISLLQGAKDRAAEAYLEAISLGERRSAVIGRAVGLLFEQKRFVEADQVIRRLQEQQTAFTGDLTRLAAETSLRLQDYDRALDLAQSVATHSKRYQDHVWVGQVLALLGRLSEAEQQLREAAKLAGSEPDPWIALIQVLVRAKRLEDAKQVIEEARTSVAPEQALITVAQCFEIIGDVESAEDQYRQALKQSPSDIAARRRLVEFYLRQRRPADAEPHLRKIVSQSREVADSDLGWARRNLALIVGGRGGAGYREAIALLEANAADGLSSRSDERAKALTLASQPSRSLRQQAAEILAKLLAETRDSAPDDRFILAELYRQNGELAQAATELRTIIAVRPDEPRYLASYCRVLLNRGETSEAELWVDRLSSVAPGQISTVDVKALLLYKQGRDRELVRLLTEFAAATTDDAAARRRWAAEKLESYSQRFRRDDQDAKAGVLVAAASALFEQLAEADAQERPSLAAFRARQGDSAAALELLPEDLERLDPRHLANVTAAFITSGKASLEDLERLQRRLEMVAGEDGDASVDLAIADLRSWRGDYNGAVAMYERVLKKDPRHSTAMNNLSLVLGLGHARHGEALALVGRAIETFGAAGHLLDTRGLIYLAAGRISEAREDFERAIAEADTPDRNLHLSVALARLGDAKGAKAALSKAYSLGLVIEQLHPLERALITDGEVAKR